jgi:hypothetical protein
LIVETSNSSNNKAENVKERTGTILKLSSDSQDPISQHQVTSGCPICSVYGALAKKGWLKARGEMDYKNHLMARHGLEV